MSSGNTTPESLLRNLLIRNRTERLLPRLVNALSGVPDRDNPHGLPANPIEEPIRRYDDFTVWEIGKLGKLAPRLREPFKAAKASLRALMELAGSAGVVAADVCECIQELGPGGGSEANAHRLILFEQLAALSKNGVQRRALAGLDLPIAARKRLEDLPLLLRFLIGIEAQHDRASSTSLRDDHRLPGAADPLENGRGVLSEIRDRDNPRDLCHGYTLQEYD
jgi:hypothetical protein